MEVQKINAGESEQGAMLKSALTGSNEALSQVLSGLADKLYWAAFRVLDSHHEAEDAVQDGLLAAIRNLNTFEGRAQFSTWLTRVVINAALMRRRKLRAHTTTSIDQATRDESEACLATKIADPRPDPEEACTREERLMIAKQCLETLPASYRSALQLRDIEGRTTREAAAALQVSEGTLKSRLYRARLELSIRVRDTAGCSHSHEPRRLQTIEKSEHNGPWGARTVFASGKPPGSQQSEKRSQLCRKGFQEK
jgi:RNA polymerase sigma-70 factor (ECF subfamily)